MLQKQRLFCYGNLFKSIFCRFCLCRCWPCRMRYGSWRLNEMGSRMRKERLVVYGWVIYFNLFHWEALDRIIFAPKSPIDGDPPPPHTEGSAKLLVQLDTSWTQAWEGTLGQQNFIHRLTRRWFSVFSFPPINVLAAERAAKLSIWN